MQNIKPIVYAALLNVCPRVFPIAPPDDFEEFPCVSYLEIYNAERATADDEEYVSDIDIAIDLWGETPEELSALALSVNAEMRKIGGRRVGCQDLPPDDGVQHKNMIYNFKEV